MQVRLIAYSQPNLNPETYEDNNFLQFIKTPQDLVAFCARVSNPTNQYNTETSEKLLRYLINNNHWSPFELVSACLEITTTRDIARQILRHRSFSFQEFSQRYADPVKELSFTLREPRLQDTKNRQNSIEVNDEHLENEWMHQQYRVIEAAKEAYRRAIARGIAKEQARAVLPEGLIESKIYMNGTLRSWIHYIELRSGNGTQKEHREISIECANALSKVFPIIKEFV